MIVVKFGGSSLADGARIQVAAQIVARQRLGLLGDRGSEEPAHAEPAEAEDGTHTRQSLRALAHSSLAPAVHSRETRTHEQVVCVVSALAGVTDELFSIAALARQQDERWYERLTALRDRHLRALAHLTGQSAIAPSHIETLWSTLESDLAYLAARYPATAAGNSESLILPSPRGRGAGGEVSSTYNDDDEATQAVSVFSAWGERLAVALFAQALANEDNPAFPFEREPVIVVEQHWGLAAHLALRAGALAPRYAASVEATRSWLAPRLAGPLRDGYVPVLPGYLARTREGASTTLGRNGSDYSAAVIGAALHTKAVYLYSDVAGIHQADPQIIPEAPLLPDLTYADVAAIASLGARVVHPAALAPLAEAHIPLHLRSALDPEAPGTTVGDLTPAFGHPSPIGEGTVGHALPHAGNALCAHSGEASSAAPLLAGEGVGGEVFAIVARPITPEHTVARTEITVVLLAHEDWREDTGAALSPDYSEPEQQHGPDESHPALVAAALALLGADTPPLELALSSERLRVTVPAASSPSTQRRLYDALAPSLARASVLQRATALH